MNDYLKRKLNPFKTRFFKILTSSFKNSNNISDLSKIDKNDIKRILISRPNHRLGNQLLLSPIIQIIEAEFPNCTIDLLVNGNLSRILYKNYSSVGNVYNLPKKPFKNLYKYLKTSFKVLSVKYDLGIVGTESSNSSKIFVKLSRTRFKIFNSGENTITSKHIAKKPIDIFLNLYKGNTIVNYPKLDIKLTDDEISIGKSVLSNFFSNSYDTIAIFTNATGNKKLSKKCWQELCSKIISEIPDTNILEILPKENTSQLDFKYKNYLSSDLREMASVIENSVIFISADSGVMHLATATNTPTFGLFNGSTDSEIYGPYGRCKYVIETKKIGIDELIKDIKKTFYNNGYK